MLIYKGLFEILPKPSAVIAVNDLTDTFSCKSWWQLVDSVAPLCIVAFSQDEKLPSTKAMLVLVANPRKKKYTAVLEEIIETFDHFMSRFVVRPEKRQGASLSFSSQ